MPVLYIVLLVGLGFAGFVLVVLSVVFIHKECCQSTRSSQRFTVDEEDVETGMLDNNNTNNVDDNITHPRVLTIYQPDSFPPGRLTFRASAPTLTDLNFDQPQTRRIRTITSSSTQSIEATISLEEMRAVQAGILRNETERLDCNLIIGVCATSIDFCGYCVNLQDKWVEFYKIQTEHLPWQFAEQPDNSEMEMRNFFFALMLWSDQIEESKRFHIYTGSHAISCDNNRLWRKAAKLLEHFSACQGIIVGNDCRYYVNSRKDVKAFATKILPAEDLSLNNFKGFQDFISRFHGIPLQSFQGTHNLTVLSTDVTENYQLFIDKVRDARLVWTNPCDKCAYIDDDAAAAASFNTINQS